MSVSESDKVTVNDVPGVLMPLPIVLLRITVPPPADVVTLYVALDAPVKSIVLPAAFLIAVKVIGTSSPDTIVIVLVIPAIF